MNDRERFEAFVLKEYGEPAWLEQPIFESDLYAGWQACAESKQSELDKANAEVELYLSAYKLAHKQAMDNGQARDEAKARIAQLEEALLWYVHNDDVSEGGKWEQENEYWLEGKRNAQKLLAESSDTRLLEHDKIVEVRVLDDVVNHCAFFSDRDEVMATIIAMIESRK